MGISVTGVKPGNTTVTINSKTSPNISKKVQVTVKSRNLLAYGTAEGNGLTATVNTDGSLHVTGTAARHRYRRTAVGGLGVDVPMPGTGHRDIAQPHLYRRVDRQRQIPRRQRTPARRSGHLGQQCRCNPCRHRQPALRNPLQRGHAHREGRRPQSPARIRRHRARVDATRQHEP